MAILQTLRNISREEFYGEMVDEPTNIAEVTEVESSLIEAQENEEELNDIEADLDVAEDAMDSMEDLISSLEEAVYRGGMTPAEARQYRNHRKLIYKNMGEFDAARRGVATEAFAGISSRLTMTKIALEEEKGTLTKWWEAIVRFIKAAAQKTVDFIVGLFSTVQAIQGRAQSIYKEANDSGSKAEGKLTKEKAKKYGKLFRFTNDGEVDTADDVLKHLKDAVQKASSLPTATQGLTRLGKDLATLLSNDQNNKPAGLSIQAGNNLRPWTPINDKDKAEKIGKELESNGEKGGDKATSEYQLLAECYAGYALVQRTDTTKYGRDDLSVQGGYTEEGNFLDISYSLVFGIGTKVEENDNKLFDISNLDKDKIKSVAQGVISLCNDFRKLGDDIKKYNKTFDQVVAEMSKKVKSIPENIIGLFKKIGSMIKKLFSGGNGLTKWYKYLLTTAKDLLNVLSIRLSTAPGDDDDKKDDKKDETPAAAAAGAAASA